MVNLILIIAILLSNTTSLVLKRKHYDLFYQSVFKEIWLNYKEVNQRYPNKVLSIIDSHSKISEYYIHKYKTGTAFTHLSSFKTSYELKEFIVQNLHHDYLYLGHLSSNDPITVPLIQAYYPTIEWQKNYSGGNSFLFSKTPKRTEEHIVSFLNFETQSNPFWGNIEPANIIDSLSFNGECYYTIDSLQEWGPTFIKPLDSIILNPNNFIDISLKVKSPSKIEDVLLAATLETPDTTFYWSSASSNTQIAPSSNNEQWFNLYHSVKLSDICLNYDAIKLKVFVWNKGKKLIYIDDFKISLRKGNPLLYGLSEDFEE